MREEETTGSRVDRGEGANMSVRKCGGGGGGGAEDEEDIRDDYPEIGRAHV